MITALIVAAGQGRRMGADIPKQYLPLDGQPILTRTIKSFDGCNAITQLILVVPEDDIQFCQEKIIEPAGLQKPVTIVTGGKRRQDSVRNGLNAISSEDGIVLIHDGARPFITSKLINACVTGAQQHGACIPAIPVVDTLKLVDKDSSIQGTVSREGLYMAQTPQAFRLPIIKKAHKEAKSQGWLATDDAYLVEQLGKPVHIVQGARENIKITTPEDMALVELEILRIREQCDSGTL